MGMYAAPFEHTADLIIKNLIGRHGLRQAWDDIDSDALAWRLDTTHSDRRENLKAACDALEEFEMHAKQKAAKQAETSRAVRAWNGNEGDL